MGTFLEFLSDISRVTVAASSENRVFRDSTSFCKSFYEKQIKYMLRILEDYMTRRKVLKIFGLY